MKDAQHQLARQSCATLAQEGSSEGVYDRMLVFTEIVVVGDAVGQGFGRE